MLESLGLGIRLELTDNVSRRAQGIQNSFNNLITASGNLCASVNELNSAFIRYEGLTIAGFALQRIGNEFTVLGRKIKDSMVTIGTSIISTGAQFESYRKTLQALYKDVAEGNKVVQWGMNLAARTPFEIGDVVETLVGMKAMGVEARQQFQNINGEMKSFMEYVGDLAALRPDQGMKGVMMAIREYIGGNAVSMRRRLEVDPETVLGRGMGATVEQRMKDIVEVAQKLAPDLMAGLFGTWNQTVSNIRDQVTRLLLGISDSGAFDKAKATLAMLYNTLADLGDLEIAQLGKNLAGVFTMLWQPIHLLGKGLVVVINALKTTAKEFPVLFKVAGAILGFIGVTSLALGAVLKFGGVIIMAIASLATFYVTMIQFRMHEYLFSSSIGRSTRAVWTFMKSMGLLSLIITGAVLAWSNNWLGFRDVIKEWSDDFVNSYTRVKRILNHPDLMSHTYGFNELEKKLSKIVGFLQLIRILFTQDTGKSVFFTDTQKKMLELIGMWDLAVYMVMLKGKIQEFFKGLAEGFKIAYEIGKAFINIVWKPFEVIVKAISNYIEGITGKSVEGGLFGMIVGSDAHLAKYQAMGKSLGTILGILLGFKAVKGLTSIIAQPFSALFKGLVMIGEKTKWIRGLTSSGTKEFVNNPFIKQEAWQKPKNLNEPFTAQLTGSRWNRFKTERMLYGQLGMLRNYETAHRVGLVGEFLGAQKAWGRYKDNLSMDVLDDSTQSRLNRFLFGRRLYTYGEKDLDLGNGQVVTGLQRELLGRQGGIFKFGRRNNGARDTDFRYYGMDDDQYSKYRRQYIRQNIERTGLGRAVFRGAELVGSGISYVGDVADRRIASPIGRAYNAITAPLYGSALGQAIYRASARSGTAGFWRRPGESWVGARARQTGMVARGAVGGIRRGVGAAGRGLGLLGGGLLAVAPWLAAAGAVGYGLWAGLGTDKETGERSGATFLKNAGKLTGFLGSKDGEKQANTFFENFIAQAPKYAVAIAKLFMAGFKLLYKVLPGMFDKLKEKAKETGPKIFEWLKTDGVKMFVDLISWLIPTAIQAFISIGIWLVTKGLPGVITIIWELIKALGTKLWEGLVALLEKIGKAVVKALPDWLVNLFGGSGNTNITVTDSRANKDDPNMVGVHHGGLWLNPNEKTSIIRRDETVLPPTISRKLNSALNNGSFGSAEGGSISIAKVDIIVQAEKLSRADARKQAQMILEEFEGLKRSKQIRNGTNNVQLI